MSKTDDIPRRRSQLSAAKRALLEKRLRGELGGRAEAPVIPRRVDKSQAPLSFAQERLWFLDQLVPGNCIYNCIDTLRFDFPLDVAVLERSLNEIVRRHESLRTTFKAVDGVPIQVVAPRLNLPLQVVELRKLPNAEREAEALRLATEEAQRPFDLSQGPLIRTTLLRLAEQEYMFLLTMHHIISDGWSMGVFWNELSVLWSAFAAGESSPLPELPVQYLDFAVWQRQYLQGQVLESQLTYWKSQLTDLPVLQLLADHPRPAVQTFRGANYPMSLPASMTRGLKALSQREGVTLFMTLLAAFQAVLYRYTGQDDIVVGTYIAGRNRAELEGLIGFFINTLVMRTDLSGNPSFRQLLGRVREVALGAYAHQDVPFAKLVQELQPERDLSRNPLFQVLFHLFNAPNKLQQDAVQDTSDLSLEVRQESAVFDLVLTLVETPEGLRGGFEYSTQLFEAATIARLAGHYRTLLEGIVAHPGQRLSDMPLLSDAERHQLLEEWNATEISYSYEESVVSVFEEQVKRSPQGTAFMWNGEELSYGELNRRANQLANYLRAIGLKRGSLVGVLLERGHDLAVSLLAIFKAGGAYVPLDPSYPHARLAFMLKEAQVSLLISRKELVAVLAGPGTPVVLLGEDRERIAQQSELNLSTRASPEDLAYVIFTSGSTGKPKGVAVEHKQLLNRFAWMWEAYPFCPGEVCCQKTAVSFVDSLWELLGPLLQGVKTLVIPEEVVKDSEALVNTLAENGVSRIWVVPSFLRLLLDSYPDLQRRLPKLKFWVTTGEALPIELFQRFRELMPQSLLYNLYGTSEVWDATWYDPEADQTTLWRVPIGRPISNMQAYVLDRQLQLVPIGVPGELYIGGVGLAKGYLHRPELTAEKFVSNPFSKEPRVRLYKTGDLVRYRSDGNIEYLGRLDHQVKIRGFRVELGEVESVLAQHPAVRQVAVVAREDSPDDQRLAAYIVRNPASGGLENQSAGTVWSAEWIPQWQEVWNETYRQEETREDPTFNTSGFNSSYTGLSIPAREVGEWVNNAVERVLSLRPSEVLEIGCGAGLLLFRIAPHCRRYCGMDFSSVALSYVEQQLAKLHLPQVSFFQRTAEDFKGFEPASFDAIVLNSVVQYFPNINYLVQVLEGAVRLVRPGGSIFVGDVRSLSLMQAFHTSVELRRAPASLSLPQLQERVRERMIEEEELAIDPAFFFALKEHLPQICHVAIQPKRGHHRNEFSCFRYDVTLRLGAGNDTVANHAWLDWQKDQLSLPRIHEVLLESKPRALGIRRVSNARLTAEMLVVKLLASPNGLGTVEDLRNSLRGFRNERAVDPEEFWALQDEVGYSVYLHWSGPGADDCYDVLMERRASALSEGADGGLQFFAIETGRRKPWGHYANSPLQGMVARRLVPELRRFLQERLPDHMVPSAFVVLEALPLTPSGKLDRRALPAPNRGRPELDTTYVAPRTPVEEVLTKMYGEVLAMEHIGIHDNFFTELRGHSLLATRLLSRVCDAFQIELPLRAIFEKPTVAKLAQLVEETRSGSQKLRGPSIVRLSRNEHPVTIPLGGT